MPKVCAISDCHGYLPTLPKADILLMAGDMLPVWNHNLCYQSYWLQTDFTKWLESLEIQEKYLVAGNHCLILEHGKHLIDFNKLPCTYLEDSFSISKTGLKVYGSPWQNPFGYGWAFNLPELDMAEKWATMPRDVDIILSHGPPYGYGDISPWPIPCLTGCQAFTDTIKKVQPKLICYGHIHSGYGKYTIGKSILLNSCYVDNSYKPVNKPWVVDI